MPSPRLTRPRLSTYSIVAADPNANEVGVAVQSKFLASGALVAWARGGVGAVATQAFAEVTYGPRGLDLLESGLSPQKALDSLLEGDDARGKRQVGIVDAAGRSASFTGDDCFGVAASLTGPNYACQGNILSSEQVVPAMAEAFESTPGPLAERLVEALRAAQRAGGEQRGMESAGLLVYKPNGGYGGNHDRYIDLRVDHHDDPIEKLALLLSLHRLYLERPAEADLLTVDPPLEAEIRVRLEKLGKIEPDADLWEALEDYMGWENLEERWVGPGRIDPKVLAYLREQAG
jgi:uncharacterized Ntn-hydrolase superfamily protein